MPLPNPDKKSQTQQEFVSSCMASEMMRSEYKDQKQRAAVCYSQWKRHSKKAKASSEAVAWENVEDEIKRDGFILG